MYRIRYRLKYPFSLLYGLLTSLLAWFVFYPGILSLDSLYMYLEASSKLSLSDEKALLLPFALSLILKSGGSLGLLILFQCVAGFLSIRYLALSIASRFELDGMKRDLAALLVLFVLSSPLFLASIYFVTFWMDTWLAILMLLAASLLIELFFRPDLDIHAYRFRIFILIVVSSLALLVRLNSFVLYPVLALGLWRIMNRRSVKIVIRVGLLACPLVLVGLFLFMQYHLIKVNRSYQVHTVLALDMASVLENDPSICNKALLSSCDVLSDGYPCNFRVGDGALDCTYDQAKGIVYRPFFFLRTNSALEADYEYILRAHPLALLTVKVLNFGDYLRPVTYRYFYQFQDPKLLRDAGLASNPLFSILRDVIYDELEWVSKNPILRWFSFVHLPWLVMDLISVLACLILSVRSKIREDILFYAIILSLPVSYYLSYVIAITASDFRFMFPSTLVMQVIVLSCLFSIVMHTRKLINRQNGIDQDGGFSIP